jgi:thiamine pyrophosphate-dependent acetolactate synthase large subunit-like protein
MVTLEDIAKELVENRDDGDVRELVSIITRLSTTAAMRANKAPVEVSIPKDAIRVEATVPNINLPDIRLEIPENSFKITDKAFRLNLDAKDIKVTIDSDAVAKAISKSITDSLVKAIAPLLEEIKKSVKPKNKTITFSTDNMGIPKSAKIKVD